MTEGLVSHSKKVSDNLAGCYFVCLIPSTGENIRFNGRLFGNINGITLTGLLVDLIAITKDGRVYVIIRNPPSGLAHSLKILTPFADAIGWSMSVKNAKGVPNGFSLIGDRFTRNVVISFDTGKIIN